jgi:hypothetical protein
MCACATAAVRHGPCGELSAQFVTYVTVR